MEQHTVPTYRQEADLVVNVLAINTATVQSAYAFTHSGHRVMELMGCSRRHSKAATKMELYFYALLSSFRSLTLKDRNILVSKAQAEDRHVSVIVNAIDKYFLDTLEQFTENRDALNGYMDEYLPRRIADFIDSFNMLITPNHVLGSFPAVKRAYTWAARVLEIPHKDPLSDHVMPSHYATTDKRIINMPVYERYVGNNPVTSVVSA